MPVLTRLALSFTSLIEAGDKLASGPIGKTLVDDFQRLNVVGDNAAAGIHQVTDEELKQLKAAEKAGHFQRTYNEIMAGAEDAASGAAYGYDTMADAAADAAAKAKDLAAATEESNQALLDAPGNALAVQRTLLDLNGDLDAGTEKQKALNDAIRQYGPNSAQAKTAARELQGQMLNTTGDIQSYAQEQARLNGFTGDAKNQAVGQIQALKELEKMFPQLTGPIEAYIAELSKIPGAVHTEVTIGGGGKINPADSSGRRVHRYAEGGWVPGPVGAAQMAVVHGGEFVLSRKMLANGSTVSRSAPMTVNIYMPPGSDGESVVAAIKRFERNNAAGWRS